MGVIYLDDGNDDGTVLGQAAGSKIAFHGVTAITQVAIAASITTSVSSGGTLSVLQAATIITLVNDLRTQLIDKGLVKA